MVLRSHTGCFLFIVRVEDECQSRGVPVFGAKSKQITTPGLSPAALVIDMHVHLWPCAACSWFVQQRVHRCSFAVRPTVLCITVSHFHCTQTHLHPNACVFLFPR